MSYPDALPPAAIPPLNFEGSPIWSSAFLLTPNFCDCSFHGRCISVNLTSTGDERRICECDAGWTGFSDFMDARGASCHVNEEAIRYLWVANLAFWTIVLVTTVPKVYALLLKHFETKEKQRVKGKSFKIWDNKGLLSALLGLGMCAPSLMLVGILRIAFPNARIAFDALMTFLWFWGRLGIAISTATHQPALMKQMMRAQSSADEVIRMYDIYGRVIAALQTLAAFWAIPVLVTRGQDVVLARVCFALFCGQVALVFFLFFFQSIAIRKVLYRILTESAKSGNSSKKLELVRDRLCASQLKIRNQTAVQFVLYLAYLVAPPLWLTYDYMLPISWFTPPIVWRNVVVAISDEKARGDNSQQTAGMSQKNSNVPPGERKPFEAGAVENAGKSEHFDDSHGSFLGEGGATSVVDISDVDDRLLTATGTAWSHLTLLRGLAAVAKPLSNSSLLSRTTSMSKLSKASPRNLHGTPSTAAMSPSRKDKSSAAMTRPVNTVTAGVESDGGT